MTEFTEVDDFDDETRPRRQRRRNQDADSGDHHGNGSYGERRDHELTQVDRLDCLGQADQARDEYVDLHKVKMRERQDALAQLQTDYRQARRQAKHTVHEVNEDLADILKPFTRDRGGDDLELVRDAWEHTKHRLEHCGHGGHDVSCIDDFHFEHDDVHHTKTPVLIARQTEYDEVVNAAEARFDALIDEPEALTTRVQVLADEVAELKTDAGDGSTADPVDIYVRALVAKYHASTVWSGFMSSNDYDDCLRKCLLCSGTGRLALRKIKGELTVRSCQVSKHDERCRVLKENLKEETIAEYEELKREKAHGHR